MHYSLFFKEPMNLRSQIGGTPLCSSVASLALPVTASVGGQATSLQQCWQSRPNLSLPRAHAGVVSASGDIYVLGGRSQVQQVQKVLKSVEVYRSGGGSR